MGGMGGGGRNPNDPTVVSAFHHALLIDGLVVAGLLAVVFLVWRRSRTALLRRAAASGGSAQPPAGPGAERGEPAGRRLIRVGFGLLWLLDGILQGQASMPLGLIPRVVVPAGTGSPGWVHHVAGWVIPVWAAHPVTAAASVVWIQVGIGLFLLTSGRGGWSRLAGGAGAAWGLIVWTFGEAFGSVFGPDPSWLFGAPGAAAFYVVAGALVALPETIWSRPDPGRRLLRAAGVYLIGMAVLQAWPGRGFWPGPGATGLLSSMIENMARTPQPAVLASMVRAFAGFDAAHGWAVNLFAVGAPGLIGAGLCSGHRRWVGAASGAALVVGLADWVLVEDLGFMGGVGTDPNSMIPLLLLIGGGYLAWTRLVATVPAPAAGPAPALPWRRRLMADPAYALRLSVALAALGVILVGAAPMAVVASEAGHRSHPAAATVTPGSYHSWSR
ncbi:MAG: hypothetical protein M0Z30_04225 [Actinomycetota bacterium]|nr:hypothetical protein [Actinomycetota bacterium]